MYTSKGRNSEAAGVRIVSAHVAVECKRHIYTVLITQPKRMRREKQTDLLDQIWHLWLGCSLLSRMSRLDGRCVRMKECLYRLLSWFTCKKMVFDALHGPKYGLCRLSMTIASSSTSCYVELSQASHGLSSLQNKCKTLDALHRISCSTKKADDIVSRRCSEACGGWRRDASFLIYSCG